MTTSLQFSFNKTVSSEVNIQVGHDMSEEICHAVRQLRPDNIVIICDEAIRDLYCTPIVDLLQKTLDCGVHVIPILSQETHKSLKTLDRLSEEFFANGGTAKTVIVSVGGGITGNMAGLLASVVYRGVSLVHIPTTLLAQLDSAVDVKQSVNTGTVKNAIGTTKAPDAVIIDTAYLSSLTERELRSGLGEAVKHGFAQDMAFVEFLISADTTDETVLQEIILTTIKLKIIHWEATPGLWDNATATKRLTHLGHTTGKILEMLDLDYLTHGEAISHGMVIEAYLSYKLGFASLHTVNRVSSVLKKLGLLHPLSKLQSGERIVSALYANGSQPVFALVKSLGKSDILSTTAPETLARQAVDWHLANCTVPETDL